MNKKIYLDNASTTPVDEEVFEAMKPYFSKKYGNPSSIHSFGQDALVAIDHSREKIADFLNCDSEEIVFTGSATEANNIFIIGAIKNIDRPHVITTAIEHDAVLETVKSSADEYTILPVDKEGFIDLNNLKEEIREETALVSIMYANNEIGTIQKIEEIGSFIDKINKDRDRKILFHIDAVQAAGYLDCDVEKLKVDGLTLSGHKIYGPKGVGALYKSNDVSLDPIIYGGGQENGLRSGTYNTPLIVGLGKAVEILDKKKKKETTEELRDYLIDQVLKIEGSSLNGPRKERLPNNTNFSFEGVEGESMVLILDQEGIAVSTGSACSSKTLEASHVLRAIGLESLKAHSSVRISLGRKTEKKELEKLLKILPAAVKRLRKISGR